VYIVFGVGPVFLKIGPHYNNMNIPVPEGMEVRTCPIEAFECPKCCQLLPSYYHPHPCRAVALEERCEMTPFTTRSLEMWTSRVMDSIRYYGIRAVNVHYAQKDSAGSHFIGSWA